jgi:hypothetical protein
MVRTASKIIFFNEMTSEGEFIETLGEVETLSSDLDIFSLWISSVWGEDKTTSICFVGVAEAVSGGIWRIDADYSMDFREADRRSSALSDINVTLIFWTSFFISLASAILILSVSFCRELSYPRDYYWLSNYDILSLEILTSSLDLTLCNSTLSVCEIMSS